MKPTPYRDKYWHGVQEAILELQARLARQINAVRAAGVVVDTTLYDNGHDEILITCDSEHPTELVEKIMEETP